MSTGILTKFSSLILIWRAIHVYSQIYGFWLILIWCNWDRIVLSPLLLLTHTVVSDTLWPHGLQHAKLPCPTPSPGVFSNSCPLSWWCHPTISSSVAPFFSCLQSFPASVFVSESALHFGWPNCRSFSFSISPFNEYCFECKSGTYRKCLRDRTGFESKLGTQVSGGFVGFEQMTWHLGTSVSSPVKQE